MGLDYMRDVRRIKGADGITDTSELLHFQQEVKPGDTHIPFKEEDIKLDDEEVTAMDEEEKEEETKIEEE